MTHALNVLVITHDNNSNAETRIFRQKMVHILPGHTRIDYAVYGNANLHANPPEVQAEVKDYDFVILSSTMAEHYGTPAVIDSRLTIDKRNERRR